MGKQGTRAISRPSRLQISGSLDRVPLQEDGPAGGVGEGAVQYGSRGRVVSSTSAASSVDMLQTRNGTFSSSAFMTFNSAVGTGILTLPYAFRCLGLYGGAVGLLLFVVIEFATVDTVIRCAGEVDARTYPDIVKEFMGGKWCNMFSAIIYIYCFFACNSGLIILKNVLRPVVDMAAGSDVQHSWWTSDYALVTAAALVALPFMFLKEITSLRFTAMLSFGAILYVVVVVVTQYRQPADDSVYGKLDSFGEFPSALLAIPNLFVALQCHIQVPGILVELPQRPGRVIEMRNAVATTYSIIFGLYLTIAVFGLLTFRRTTRPNIMECNYDPKSPWIIIARVCLAFNAILSIPVNHFPAREALWALIHSGDPDRGPPTRRFFEWETILFFAANLALACFIHELSTLNDLMGLSAGVAVIFLLPARFLLSDNSPNGVAMGMYTTKRPVSRTAKAYIFFIVGVLTFGISVYSFVWNTYFDVEPPSP